jgi:chromosome segregation ATPase
VFHVQVSILTEKAKSAHEQEERARSAVSICENQHQELMSRIRHEKEEFERSLDRKSDEFIASQHQTRHQLERKTKSAMNQLCENQAAVFEEASRELSYRQEQISLMVSNISKFRVHFASWAEEKQKLTKQLAESTQSHRKCRSLLEKTEQDLMHSQRQCTRLQTNIQELNTLTRELEQDKSDLRARISRLEKKASDLEVSELACRRELDQVKASKNNQLEQKAQKLRGLMQSITLQNDRLQKKQKSLEQKEASLTLHEQTIREEAAKNDELYKLVQEQRDTLKSLEKDLDSRLRRQEVKEQELDQAQERLADLESKLNQKHEESKANQQKVKELAVQLHKKNEEVMKQKQLLQERLRKCDEYEATLSAWEERLDEMANMIQGSEENSSS